MDDTMAVGQHTNAGRNHLMRTGRQREVKRAERSFTSLNPDDDMDFADVKYRTPPRSVVAPSTRVLRSSRRLATRNGPAVSEDISQVSASCDEPGDELLSGGMSRPTLQKLELHVRKQSRGRASGGPEVHAIRKRSRKPSGIDDRDVSKKRQSLPTSDRTAGQVRKQLCTRKDRLSIKSSPKQKDSPRRRLHTSDLDQDGPSQESYTTEHSEDFSLNLSPDAIQPLKQSRSRRGSVRRDLLADIRRKRLTPRETDLVRVAFCEVYPSPPSNMAAQGRYELNNGTEMAESQQQDLWHEYLKPWSDRWWELYSLFCDHMRGVKLAKRNNTKASVTASECRESARKFHIEHGDAKPASVVQSQGSGQWQDNHSRSHSSSQPATDTDVHVEPPHGLRGDETCHASQAEH